MPGPIKPKEVQRRKNASLPEEVFEVFNSLIQEDWNGTSATVMQSTAAKRIANVLGLTIEEVYEQRLLDIEDAYSEAGWDVDYDKPGYCEDYEPHFKFSKRTE